MEMKGTIQGESTAGGVAMLRYLGTFEPPSVRVNDSLAQYFVSKSARWIGRIGFMRRFILWAAERRIPGAYSGVVARTIFIDEFLKTQTKYGYFKQVVLLGGGYDTRSLRFQDIWDAHGVRGVFEVDLAHTQQKKLQILRNAIEEDDLLYNTDRVKYVVGNLDDIDGVRKNLTQAGYRPDFPSVFVMEGVVGYLTPATVNSTLEFFKQHSGPSSMLVFNFGPYINTSDPAAVYNCYGIREVAREIKRKGEPAKSVLPLNRLGNFLLEHGLMLQQHVSPGELENLYLTKPDKTTIGRVGCWEHFAVVRNAEDTPALRPITSNPDTATTVPFAVPLDMEF